MPDKIVVVGAGQAAFSFLEQLRKDLPDASLTLIGEEQSLPYQRPPLSKKYLLGEMAFDRLMFRPRNWYEENGIALKCGTRVTEIDRRKKQVQTDTGEAIGYDTLLIATGSRPRHIDGPEDGFENLHYLRSADDADHLGRTVSDARRLAIIGGGYIGLEVAAVAASKGLEVTLFEQSERILGRVAATETADFIRALHQKNNVTIVEGARASFLNDGHQVTAVLVDGQPECLVDCVLVGIGGMPNQELAARAGLATENGIVVNTVCQTSDSDIYAAGACTCFSLGGEITRLESVQNAIDQGKVAARHIAGNPTTYAPTPWFWSDQYDIKLQIVGLNRGFDRTEVRPAEKGTGQSVSYFKDGALIALDAMNDPRAYLTAKRALDAK